MMNTEEQGQAQGFAMEFRPTPMMRLRRWLGFRYHLGKEPPDSENMPGWFVTDTRFHFTLADRLRLLVSGRLKVRITGYADAKVETVKNRMDWQILAPGEADWRL